MSIHTHIQSTGLRRSTVAAFLAVAVLTLAPAGLSTPRPSHGSSQAQRIHPMPAGGCGTGGCRRAL